MTERFAGFPASEEIRVLAPEAPVLEPPPGRMPSRLPLQLGLLVATFVTTCMAGSWTWEGGLDPALPWRELLSPARLLHGIPYACLVLLILGAHEMGHYFACRYYGVSATLPFVIPGVPFLMGTFGAVIRIKAPIPSRRALFDIAAAGPIAGFVVAAPILVYGVAHAPPAGAQDADLGVPLLSLYLERLFHGAALIGHDSIYGAAWVGMFFTAMNLFPVGQLDGGHALYAVAPRWHRFGSWLTIASAGAWVVYQTIVHRMPSAYTLWLAILLILRDRHPRLVSEREPLGAGRIAVAVVLALVFVVAFIPTPLLIN